MDNLPDGFKIIKRSATNAYLMTAVRACGSTLRDTAAPRQQSLSDK